jgi:hypothetical protein
LRRGRLVVVRNLGRSPGNRAGRKCRDASGAEARSPRPTREGDPDFRPRATNVGEPHGRRAFRRSRRWPPLSSRRERDRAANSRTSRSVDWPIPGLRSGHRVAGSRWVGEIAPHRRACQSRAARTADRSRFLCPHGVLLRESRRPVPPAKSSEGIPCPIASGASSATRT